MAGEPPVGNNGGYSGGSSGGYSGGGGDAGFEEGKIGNGIVDEALLNQVRDIINQNHQQQGAVAQNSGYSGSSSGKTWIFDSEKSSYLLF